MQRRSRTKRWLIRYPRALPLGIFVLIAAITVLSMFVIARGEAQRDAAQLNTRATAIASALERRANASVAYLRAGAALLSTMDEVQPGEFRRFVSELRLDADYRGAEGIGWAEVVRPNEITAFEERYADLPTPLLVNPRPDGSASFATPVTFLQPDTERNRRALGYDMYSEPTRRAAMQEAERTTQPIASGKVILRQEGTGAAPGFVIYMPVFEAGPGGRQLKGYIYSPFSAPDFLASALELEEAGTFGVSLYDDSRSERSLLATTYENHLEPRELVSQRVMIANNPALLTVSRAAPGGLSALSMATLIFGLLVASLLMLLVRMLTQQAKEDEVALSWFEEQASIRNSLTRELNHRVKNTLANVLSIIALTRRRAENVGDFADGLDGRIRALSATHDLLTQSDWGSTPVGAVVDAELLPYAESGDHEVLVEGPEIELAPTDALSLGLAVHELSTNAAKYGALSQPGGVLSVRWKLTSPLLVRVEWIERGGPPVPQKRSRGFGTDLIERIVAHELRTPVELDFDPAGVRCVLLIPVRRATEFQMRASRGEPEEKAAETAEG